MVDPAGPRRDVRGRRGRPDAATRRRSCCCTRWAARRTSPGSASSAELSRTHRVVALDLRWHGRGIRSPRFRIDDCADDVAARARRARHRPRRSWPATRSAARSRRSSGTGTPSRVSGAGARLDRAQLPRPHGRADVLPGDDAGDAPAVAGRAGQGRAGRRRRCPSCRRSTIADAVDWGRSEFRSTSAWSMPEVLGELGRFNSAPWIGSVDVPTAVVVTGRDKAIPTRRQRRLAAAIPGARVYDAPGGHASVVLDHDAVAAGLPRGGRRRDRPGARRRAGWRSDGFSEPAGSCAFRPRRGMLVAVAVALRIERGREPHGRTSSCAPALVAAAAVAVERHARRGSLLPSPRDVARGGGRDAAGSDAHPG